MEKKKILFVTQEISPFLPKSEVASTSRRLPQGIQEGGKEIRVFTPRFGNINERRHQLHEVIRLSGLNLVINDNDHPLIIKVASVSAARMQVYFIDNDEYFKRKSTLKDDKGEFHADNDERSMFFCRGVLETVKKLGWQPDVIHCHGWMSGLMSLYLKNVYNDSFNKDWDAKFPEKLKFDGFSDEVVDSLRDTSFENVSKVIMQNADALNISSENLDPALQKLVDEQSCLVQEYVAEENQTKVMSEFFDKVIEEEILI
jgi:starch synthase